MNGTKKTILVACLAIIAGVWAATGLVEEKKIISHACSGMSCMEAQKYAGGHEELITFFAREHADSDHMIARKALLIKRPGAQITALVFHGFMCDKYDVRFLSNALFGRALGYLGQNGDTGRLMIQDPDNMSESENMLRELRKAPFNTLVIDFRAHGDAAAGQCCSFGKNEMFDVIGAVDYVKSHPDLKNTVRVAYGFSMGAVASILAQAHDPTLFDMAIWDCPFDSTEKLLERMVDKLKISAFGYEIGVPGRSVLQKYVYNEYVQSILKFMLKTVAHLDTRCIDTCIMPINTVTAMKSIKIPVLIIGRKQDEKAPIEAVHRVYDAAQGYKSLWISNGRTHFDSYFFNPEKYIYIVRHFIQEVFDGSYKHQPQTHILEDRTEEPDALKSARQ